MNSALYEIEQYSARNQNEHQALMTNRDLTTTMRKQDFYIKSQQDNTFKNGLSQTSEYLLCDRAIYIGKVQLEQRLQDIDEVILPFDSSYQQEQERLNRTRDLSKTSQSSNSTLKIEILKKNSKKKFEFLIFSPDGTGKLIWDFFCMSLILYEIITIPMRISFDIEVSVEFGYFVTSVFLFDILITFNTAVYYHGTICYLYKQIAYDYLKMWFWIDIIASFPYDIVVDEILGGTADDEISQSQTSLKKGSQILRALKFFRFVKVIRLLRLAKLKAIVDKIEEYFADNSIIQTIGSFMKLCVFVLFWSHWLGCIFHFIGQSEDSNYNWLEIYNLLDKPWYIRYVNSVYWAVTTMVTVGYGDLSPQTPIERLFGILFLLIACGVFSFTMNTIGNTMQQLSQKQDQYQKRITEINNYMAKVKIPKQLQNKVRRYLQYIWDSHRTVNLESICSNLSLSLKYEFTIQVNGTILAGYKLLCDSFSRQLLIEMTQILLEQTVQPDEYVFIEDEIKNEQTLYFIQEGQINIVLIQTRQIVARLKQKEVFGEINFFGNIGRTASAKSKGFTDVFVLKRDDLLTLLNRFPEDREKFNYINQEVNKKELQILDIHCYACDLPGHVIRDCPSLHFVVDLQVFQKTKQRCIKAIMKDFIRRDRINFHSRRNRMNLEKVARIFQKEVPIEQFLNEECNVNDIDPKIHQQEVNKTFKLKSKFKEDKNRRHNLQQTVKQSAEQIKQIQIKQQELFTFTKNISQAIISQRNSSQSSYQNLMMYQESEFDGQSDTNTIQQKMEEIMGDYQIFKEEVNKYNGAQQIEIKKSFFIINDFEVGADFNSFYPHNNLSIVVQEFRKFQLGNSVKPKIETEYDQNVYQEYLDYYVIDIEDVKRFKFEVKPSQIKQFLPYTQQLASQYARQRKKNEGLIKQPQRTLKQVVRAIMFAKQFK